MDVEEVDERVTAKVKGVMQESQRQLLQEMNNLMQKISDQNCNLNEEQLLKIRSIVAMPNFKRKRNEEQFKVNSKVMLRLDDAEKTIESSSAEKTKEKIVEGKP